MSAKYAESEPPYRSKQTEARGRQQEIERLETLRSINMSLDRLAAEQAANRTQLDTHEKQKKKRDWLTFAALVATAFAAIGTICASIMIAKEQHADTVAALTKTDQVISETKNLTNETQRAANIAQQNLVISRRPWLDIVGDVVINEPLTASKDGHVDITLKVTAKNTGGSPALSAYFNAAISLDEPGLFNTQEIIDTRLLGVCKSMGYDRTGTPGTYIIMPNDTKDLDPVQTSNQMDNKREHRVNPMISACISYTDEFRGRFDTGQMFLYFAEDQKPITNTSIGMIPG
jgi:hypothetical protein